MESSKEASKIGNGQEEKIPDVVMKKQIPPDGGYGWVICFAVFLCNLLSHGPLYCFGILFHHLVNEFECTHTSVAFVGSIMVCFKFTTRQSKYGSLISRK